MGKKRGRPAKPGERYACGKLKPTGEPISGAAWAKTKSDYARLLTDPRLSSQVGRLSFERLLTDEEAAAAHRVGAIYGAFEHHKGLNRSARSPSYEMGFGGHSGVAEELLAPDVLGDLERRIVASTEAFLALQEFLKDWPRPTNRALEELCVEDRCIGAGDLWEVKHLLRELVKFFGTTNSRKRAQKKPKPKFIPHPTASATPAPARSDIDKAVWRRAVKILRPDLSDGQIGETVEFLSGLRTIEVQKRKKPAKRSEHDAELARLVVAVAPSERTVEARDRGQAIVDEARDRLKALAQQGQKDS